MGTQEWQNELISLSSMLFNRCVSFYLTYSGDVRPKKSPQPETCHIQYVWDAGLAWSNLHFLYPHTPTAARQDSQPEWLLPALLRGWRSCPLINFSAVTRLSRSWIINGLHWSYSLPRHPPHLTFHTAISLSMEAHRPAVSDPHGAQPSHIQVSFHYGVTYRLSDCKLIYF